MQTNLNRLTAALADRYRLERELGAGGMATVYLAHDLKHDRDVAIKVLKPELAAVLGAERFVVEIKTTAALQHPHILPLFDSGTADGFLFYVMPYIQGETLRDKLNRETQLGVDEAVRIARDVADALDYAHRSGVIHRDIKPENILLHDGRPMVADFGIALAVSAAAGGRMTETGLSLGTPHYMSPEQATAEKDISARSDIYSVGSVLYEMLTGNPPHTGVSAQQVIMKIITEAAEPVTQYRKLVPPHVAAAVAMSLEKLPADRFESAKAFADALANPNFSTLSASAAAMASSAGRSWMRDRRSWAAMVAIAALGGVVATGAFRGGTSSRLGQAIRVSIVSPKDTAFVTARTRGSFLLREPVISPDGRYLAYAVTTTSGSAVYLRALDAFVPEKVGDTEGDSPFFSPDGTALGYFNHSELWRLDLSRRQSIRVGDIPESDWDILAAAWHPDGRILVSGAQGVWSVAAVGGTPTLLVAVDSARNERVDYVTVLDDGRVVLRYRGDSSGSTYARTEVRRADGSGAQDIAEGRTGVRVVDDVLFFVERDQLHATLINRKSLVPVGGAIVLTDAPMRRLGRDIAWSGTDPRAELDVVWVDSTGRATLAGVPPGPYRWPRLSPDGRRIALGIPRENDSTVINVFSLQNQTWAYLSGNTEPAWSPDSRTVYQSSGNRPYGGLAAQVADGSRAAETLLATSSGDAWPTSVSPDGLTLAYYGRERGSERTELTDDPNDLFFMNIATRDTRRFHLPGTQKGARFSPDGRWVAYETLAKGRSGIEVRPYPELDAVYRISDGNDTEPAWSADGRTLFFRRRDAMLAVPTSVEGTSFRAGKPRVLFTKPYFADFYGDQSYDVARDGRFLMMRPVPGEQAVFQVELNWLADVRARLLKAK